LKAKAYALLVLVFLACGEDETHPIASFEFSDDIDRVALNGETSKGNILFYQWSTSNGSLKLGNANASETFLIIPDGSGGMDVDVTLTVSDGKSQNETTRSVQVPEYSLMRSYGLGKSLGEEVSNDVDYEWYFDQGNSGEHSLVNCGPASVSMVIKWFDQTFTGKPVDARNTYRSYGGWWYTDDIINYLDDHDVNNRTISLDQFSNLKAEIDEGNIVILCLDMYRVIRAKYPEHHVNKFYDAATEGWGHFIVIKGYKMVDGQLYYEAYDPYSFGLTFPTGGIQGKDRYYSSNDLDGATDSWWDYAIVIDRSSPQGGRKGGVDTSRIIHKPGQ
jgi:hypothetical protein